jgi:lambda repressor-like predicted transcriptional regulator
MVELVRLYSNPEAGLKRLLKLLVKATSSPRTRERPTSRQAQVRLDHYQANALAAAYRDGKTINELADRYGIHRVTAASLLRRLGVERRRVGLSDEQVDEASRLYPEGWSLARLAERYGVNDMTVRRYLLLGGVEMRSPHERCK